MSKDFPEKITFFGWNIEDEYEVREVSEEELNVLKKFFSESFLDEEERKIFNPSVWKFVSMSTYILKTLEKNWIYLTSQIDEKYPNLFEFLND